MNCDYCRIANDVILGKNVKVFGFVNLYGCVIGDGTKIGTFVEIQKGAVIGKNVKVSSHTFICEGVIIEDDVFIGHGVTFINDKYPVSTRDGKMLCDNDWKVIPTIVRKGAAVGSGSTILCGIEVGENAVIGAGATVTKNVLPGTVVAGNPAKIIKMGDLHGKK